ncbi:hypothetical protein CHS0354_005813 [Potamilus streckersoni]|uniref:Sulfhydryl light chain n=1 Tax=Potamilus streckersoni TaxID=2493646 RepID=A0AAE0W2Y5_9BIVA|nr:hypothetical protein CHS0354_005813 [Potamilus streckersoni]
MLERLVFFHGVWKIIHYEETVVDEADSEAAYKNFILESIRKCFELSFVEGKPTINVDNIWPILKLLKIDRKDEKIIDLVREAGIETFGDIDASDFDKLVLELVERDAIVENKALWEQINREEKEKEEKEKIEKEKAKKFKKQLKNDDDEKDNENKEDEEEKESEKKKKIHGPESITRRAFRFIDADDDGYISVADIYQLMMGLGEMLTDDELARMFRAVDLNKDGRITFEDFDMFLNGPRALIEQNMDEEMQSKELDLTEVIDVAHQETLTTTPDPKLEPTPITAEEEEAIKTRKMRSVLWGYMTTTSQIVTMVKRQSSDVLINDVALIDDTTQSESKQIYQEHNQSEKDLIIDSGEKVNDSESREEDAIPIDFGFQQSEIKDDTEAEGIPRMRRKFTAEEMNNAPIKRRKRRWIVCGPVSTDAFTEPKKEETAQPLDIVGDVKKYPDGNKTDAASESKIKEKAGEQKTPDDSKSKIIKEASEEETPDNILDSSIEDEVFQDGDLAKDETTDPEKMEVIISHAHGDDKIEDFVTEHSYIEISQTMLDELLKTPEELESVERRIKQAEMLQYSIIRRTKTEPPISINRSNPQKVPSAQTQSEPVSCSQIQFDLDLSGNIPPKASVVHSKKTNKFIRVRSISAMSSLQIQKTIKAENAKSVKVLDITRTHVSDINIKHEHSYNWPRRNSVRPRSALSLMNRQTFERTASLETTDEEQAVNKKRPRTPSSPFPIRHQCKSQRIETKNGYSLLDINGDCILAGVGLAKQLTSKKRYYFETKWPTVGTIHMLEKKSPKRLNSISRKLEREGIPYRRESYDLSPCRKDALDLYSIHRETPDIQFEKNMFRREHMDSSLLRKNTQSPFSQMEYSFSRENTDSSFFEGVTACRSETSTPKTAVIQLELPPDIRKKPKIRTFTNLHGFIPTPYTVR